MVVKQRHCIVEKCEGKHEGKGQGERHNQQVSRLSRAELSFVNLADATTTIESDADESQVRHENWKSPQKPHSSTVMAISCVAVPHVHNQQGQREDVGQKIADGHLQDEHSGGAGLELFEVHEENKEVATDPSSNKHS